MQHTAALRENASLSATQHALNEVIACLPFGILEIVFRVRGRHLQVAFRLLQAKHRAQADGLSQCTMGSAASRKRLAGEGSS